MTNRNYDFSLPAQLGASRRIDARGGMIKVTSSPAGPIGVKLDGGPELELLEGQGLRLPDGQEFRDVVLRNLQAAANVGTVFIGDSRFEDTRITGSVKVIDDAAMKTMLDGQFGASFTAGAVAGQGSAVVISASGAGGKKVSVRSMFASSATAGRVLVFVGTVGGSMVPASAPLSKFIRSAGLSAAGTARANAFNTAAGTPSAVELAGVTSWFGPYVPANQPVQLVALSQPIVIEPGRLLCVSAESINRDLSIWFEVEEL